jgi:hypothetical protein
MYHDTATAFSAFAAGIFVSMLVTFAFMVVGCVLLPVDSGEHPSCHRVFMLVTAAAAVAWTYWLRSCNMQDNVRTEFAFYGMWTVNLIYTCLCSGYNIHCE